MDESDTVLPTVYLLGSVPVNIRVLPPHRARVLFDTFSVSIVDSAPLAVGISCLRGIGASLGFLF